MRLEAEIKKGFYPLPLTAVDAICKSIIPCKGTTIYDPCCGEGEAVQAIAKQLGIEPQNIYASELDQGRGRRAAERLQGSHVFESVDFISDLVFGSPSIMYCNPPFGTELGGNRSEQRFLSRALYMMAADSIAVFVVPEHVAKSTVTWELISANLRNITITPIEGPRRYNETVIIGIRRKQTVAVNWSYDARQMTTWATRHQHPLVALPGEIIRVRKQGYTDQEMEALVLQSSANSLFETKTATKIRKLQPPMELTHGHVALLLASGFLDGVVSKPGERPHVVRGSTKKVVEKREEVSEGCRKEISVEHIQLTVKIATESGVTLLEDKLETEAAAGEQANA